MRRIIPAQEPLFIGQTLRGIRMMRGLTKAQVAKIMRVDEITVSKIENQHIARTRMKTIISYLNAVGGTLVAVPTTYPLNVSPVYETEAKLGEAYIYQAIKSNRAVGGLPESIMEEQDDTN